MDNFAICFAFTVAAEGAFTMNAADPGNWTSGVVGGGNLHGTKFGISAAAYPQLDIADLSEEAAEAIYRRDYWSVIQGDALPLPVSLTLFDAAVAAGPHRAISWLQQAAGAVVDGVLGGATFAAIVTGDAGALARESLARRIEYSARLPTWSTFGLGWSRRFVALAAKISV